MKLYPGLNPFLQSVNSPINEKGFIPQSGNYAVKNDGVNPPPITYSSTGAPSYNSVFPAAQYNFVAAPSPVDLSYLIPAGAISQYNLSQQVFDQVFSDFFGTTNFSRNNYVNNGTTTGTSSSYATVDTYAFSVEPGATYMYALNCQFKGKYSAFDIEGSSASARLTLNGNFSAGIDEVPVVGQWSGSFSEYQHIYLSRQTSNPGAISFGAVSSGTAALAIKIPSGGAGTVSITDVKIDIMLIKINYP